MVSIKNGEKGNRKKNVRGNKKIENQILWKFVDQQWMFRFIVVKWFFFFMYGENKENTQ